MIRSAMNDIPEDRWEAAFGKRDRYIQDEDGNWHNIDEYRRAVQVDMSVPQRIPPQFDEDDAKS